MSNTYVFSVPATYFYEVDADTEEKARELLEEEGGMDIMGTLVELTHKEYMNATLEETCKSDE